MGQGCKEFILALLSIAYLVLALAKAQRRLHSRDQCQRMHRPLYQHDMAQLRQRMLQFQGTGTSATEQ